MWRQVFPRQLAGGSDEQKSLRGIGGGLGFCRFPAFCEPGWISAVGASPSLEHRACFPPAPKLRQSKNISLQSLKVPCNCGKTRKNWMTEMWDLFSCTSAPRSPPSPAPVLSRPLRLISLGPPPGPSPKSWFGARRRGSGGSRSSGGGRPTCLATGGRSSCGEGTGAAVAGKSVIP